MDVQLAFERVPFLRALPADDRRRLMPYAERLVLRKNERCWVEGQPTGEFVFVLRGSMKLLKASPNGRSTILETAEVGELVCMSAPCSFVPYCCSSAAMEDGTEVLKIPRRDVLEVVERSQEAARAFIREVTCRGMAMCRRVEELGSGSVERRIASLLLKLADRAGTSCEGGVRIRIPLSRQDIAELCGTTVETAIRVMSRFNKDGVVKSAARGFLVPERADLERIAHGVGGAVGAAVRAESVADDDAADEAN